MGRFQLTSELPSRPDGQRACAWPVRQGHLVRRCVQQGMLGINSVCHFAPARRCDQLPRLVFRRYLPAELTLQLQTRPTVD